ncbi:MAG: hypothetical protein AAGC79_17460 [Pseudomonadota bacterium]
MGMIALRRQKPLALLPALAWLVVHSFMLFAHAPSTAAEGPTDLYIAGERVVLCLAHGGEADGSDEDEHWSSCRWCRGIAPAALPLAPSLTLGRSAVPVAIALVTQTTASATQPETAPYSTRAPPA